MDWIKSEELQKYLWQCQITYKPIDCSCLFNPPTVTQYGIISKVEILAPNKVIRVTFIDGDAQKAVCSDEDEFNLERGIEVCLLKHYMGGTKNYNKQLRWGIKCFTDRLNAEVAELEEERRILEKKKKNAIKKKTRLLKKEKEEYEYCVQMYADAILRADEMRTSRDCDNLERDLL